MPGYLPGRLQPFPAVRAEAVEETKNQGQVVPKAAEVETKAVQVAPMKNKGKAVEAKDQACSVHAAPWQPANDTPVENNQLK